MQYEENLSLLTEFNTKIQEVKVYKNAEGALFVTLNRFVQFKEGEDEKIYHENLVNKAIKAHGNPYSFLILGGGDGLCARNILETIDNPYIVLVDIDQEFVEFCKTDDRILELNKGALDKCIMYYEDATSWVTKNSGQFDVIILDFPDANSKDLEILYTDNCYKSILHLLTKDTGVISIQVNIDIADRVSNSIKSLLGNSQKIEYIMPWMGNGVIILGKNEHNI